jgi:hypothetical protein
MRVVAIDASALGGGSITAAIRAASRTITERGGVVHHVRLYSMPTGHGVAEAGLAVSRGFAETVAAAVEDILDSDAVILGVPTAHAGPNAGTKALLRRLAACFAGHCLERGYHGRPTRLSPGRRVGLLTSSPNPLALVSGHLASARTDLSVRRTFARGDLGLVGTVCVADIPGYPLARARAMSRARDLGGMLVDSADCADRMLPAWFERERAARARIRLA